MKGDIFIFPKGEELTGDDLIGFVEAQEGLVTNHYNRNYDLYISKHKILNVQYEDLDMNNKLVVSMPKLLVDEYAGYFGGNEPQIQLDNDADNELLKQWLSMVDFADEHSEVVKSVAIYGRGYLLEYQDENSVPQIAHIEPDEGFMIYDDTVKSEPLAFVRYSYDTNYQVQGTIYYANYSVNFKGSKLGDPEPYFWHEVPAQEFYSNEERQGVFDSVVTLVDALDNALSRKANQVDYFDNAYLAMLGVQFVDEKGNPVEPTINRRQRLIYVPDADAANAKIEFIEKPNGDSMQENLINRLIDLIYQTSMIPNLRDEAFSGNSSGVALQFKLLPMQNMAAFQERKFTKALRKLFKTLLESADGGQIIPAARSDSWKNMRFIYTRNIPQNMADSINTAVEASKLLSEESSIALIPWIDSPKDEIKRKISEKQDALKRSLQNSISAVDMAKGGVDDGEETEQ